MGVFLIILCVLLLLAAGVGFAIYLHSRKVLREQKNYERGLKMVPLLIHLPPISEDTQVGGRDAREVNDENVSKAQVVYNIISSTVKKGFKTKFYGQRHFAFEIIGSRGFVQFYAAVPIVLVDVVKQAVVSAYPTARLEEVAEHNIFSPVGKISGTVGGELTLKEPYAYPIATFRDLKRDALQSILNALSTLDKEDGAGIQILMRPANNDWRKTAQSVASKKRKGDKSKKGTAQVGEWGKQLATALVKPPEDKSGGGSDKPDLSSHEQSVVDAIDDKTNHPGYEVLIRVVASSNVVQRSQTILSNIVASFSLFDAPGRNGFKFTPSKDIDSFVTAYILRFFPQESNQNILNSVELATIFHFPDQKNIPTSQLERQSSKQADGPRSMSETGTFLGYNVFRGVKKPIRLGDEDRRRHMYLVGQTGTGKSTMMENLALQDMLNGKGFAYIDPHGDGAERLLSMVPKERTEDVIYFCPSDMDYPLGLNLFEFDNPDQKDFLIQEAINILYKLYDPNRQGMMGPRFEHIFRNCALLLMADPAGGTFVDIPKLLVDPAFMKAKLKHVTDQNVLDFWTKEWPNSQRSNESGEVTSWVASKFGAFLSNEMMRNIIGQTESAFQIRQIMDEGKILLVNLSKGKTGELNSKLLGMIFVMKFQAAAMSRSDIPEDDRKDFSLYVDEFQNFSTDSFATILSEARKYRLNLTVANQFTTQLTEEIRDAVFGNIGSIIAFRVGTNDAEFLAKQFAPVFDVDDLQRVPNHNAIVRMLIGGVPTQSFSMSTVPLLGEPNAQLGQALKQLSAAKHGRPRAKVSGEIMERLKSQPAPIAPAGARPGARPGMPAAGQYPPAGYPPGRAAPPRPGAGSSFLDDWLAKRGTKPIAPPQAAGFAPAGQAPQPAPAFGQRPVMPPPAGVPSTAQNAPTAMPPAYPQPLQHSQMPPAPVATAHSQPSAPTPHHTYLNAAPTAAVAPVSPSQQPLQPPSHFNPAPVQAEPAEIKPSLQPLHVTPPPPKPHIPVKTGHEGEIKLRRSPTPVVHEESNDTIYIDQEGMLHPKDEADASATPKIDTPPAAPDSTVK
ncbi:ATP-binding protein [Candidatus Saccharibacteria bacterium]|nr:ATP-binding protein [Candidatus Saccharibacteria bacterium]